MLNLNKYSNKIFTKIDMQELFVCLHIIVHNCRTQYSTEELCYFPS